MIDTGSVTTSGFNSFDMWNTMILRQVNEVGESIEMIFAQTKASAFPPYHEERAVKIIYSCVDGKWNKSEPIYGIIVPAQEESYEFE